MAVAFTAQRKSGTAAVTSNVLSITTLTANCTTGSTVYLFLLGVPGLSLTSVSDDGGNNTWSVQQISTGLSPTSQNYMAWSYQNVGLLTTNTITTNWTASSATTLCYWLEEFSGSGGVGYTTLDQNASSNNATSTTAATGTTGTTTSTDEVAFALIDEGGTNAITKNASYTNFTTASQTNSNSHACLVSYRILTATGTQSGNATLASMATSECGIATFKLTPTPLATKPHVYTNQSVMHAANWMEKHEPENFWRPRLWTPRPVLV
jgi:hypothetical protein